MSIYIPPDYFRELHREEIFPDATRPLEVELGCGDGTFFLGMAQEHPERDFLGLERMLGRVSKTSRKVNRAGLTNAKVLRLESGYSLGWLLPKAVGDGLEAIFSADQRAVQLVIGNLQIGDAVFVSRLHLLCPDPWPKKKHAARRLVNQDEFLKGLARILVPGGEFLLKTDDAVYFEDALLSLSSRPEFERLDWPDNAFFYPTTDFEAHWLSMGRSMNRARWRRR